MKPLRSCLYECRVMHHRLAPKTHKFVYRVFMFYLNLDELDELSRRLFFFSQNRFNLFSFHDEDHLRLVPGSVQENVREYLRRQKIDFSKGRVMLLTHLRTFGYIFNPVSFYFCFDENEHPVCAIAEVGNTFREMKPYLVDERDSLSGAFKKRALKYFYVSPFMDLDIAFDFDLRVPGEKLDLRIDDMADNQRILLSSLTGRPKPLTNWNLIKFMIKYPLITLWVIFLIHWNALLLYWKGLSFHPKTANPELQRDLLNPHHSLTTEEESRQ